MSQVHKLMTLCTITYAFLSVLIFTMFLGDSPQSEKSINALRMNNSSEGGRAKVKHGSSSVKGLSACLLVNDENPRMPEWLAYHWLVLPLRSLIVAVDPASRHDPKDILMQWKEMGVEVDIWNDSHYLRKNESGMWSVLWYRFNLSWCIVLLAHTHMLALEKYDKVNPVTQLSVDQDTNRGKIYFWQDAWLNSTKEIKHGYC